MAARPFICGRCSLRLGPRIQKRLISDRLLQNHISAEWEWKQQAELVRKGQKKSMLQLLEERGYVNQIAGSKAGLDDLLTTKRLGAYVGVDPTAASLHIGHMIPFMALFWLYLHGYHTITLIGGSTAKLGDPTGRTTSRKNMDANLRKANLASMHLQLKAIWMHVEALGRKYGYQWNRHWKRGLRNNSHWLNKVSAMEMISGIGPALRMGELLSRDSVKTRLEGDGMSFAEFSYPILQAWDWWHMYTSLDIQMQIGGADQFGNIISGVEAVKHLARHHPHQDIRVPDDATHWEPIGMTVPLLTTSSGEKFGKSAGNAVWLNQTMTSPFDLYAYLVSTSDTDVERLLKLLTFIPLDEIHQVVTEHQQAPEKRVAQHLLATEFLELAHGVDVAKQTAAQHRLRAEQRTTVHMSVSEQLAKASQDVGVNPEWQNPVQSVPLNKKAPQTNADNASFPTIELPRDLIENKPFPSILYAAGLVNSRSEGQRLIANGGAYVGGRLHGDSDDVLNWSAIKNTFPGAARNYVVWNDAGDRGLLLLRVGKWKVKIVHVVPELNDEEVDVAFREILESEGIKIPSSANLNSSTYS
jgi:tyrosyl-tRNA synthetase